MKRFTKEYQEKSNINDEPLVYICVDYSKCQTTQDERHVKSWSKEGVFSREQVKKIRRILEETK